jgi:GT2 family glycosyltransferase
MTLSMSAIEAALMVGLLALSLLSANLLGLAAARGLARPRPLERGLPDPCDLPAVLVQVPLYNEGDLVERIIAAVTALDWPRDRLEIQVLDDSTDGSWTHSASAVGAASAAGFRIELIRRVHRSGYKAGALAAGLARSDAHYVAIFDADFVPTPNFLRETVGVLAADPGLAYCQCRWEHANREASFLTRVQARLLDGHFRVEQEARFRLGLPAAFNGTCGLWRCAAIADAGGWHGDTLTEDLDLSLRAHLRGWRSAYLHDLAVPGSLPESARAWRSQQFRWTKGFVQCALKLLPPVWRSDVLPLWQKPVVSLQMLQPSAFLIGICCTLLGLPFIAGALIPGPELRVVAACTSVLGIAGTLGLLLTGARGAGRPRALRESVAAVFLSTGLLLSNARAVAEALLGHRSEFVRTPKGPGASAQTSLRMRCGVPELATGCGLLGFALHEQPSSAFYLTLVIGGLLTVGLMQVLDGRAPVRPLRAGR